MNFDQETMGVRISMPIMRRDLNSDISEDYTLPDYYPEIRKLLFARPSPLLPAKFISGGRVDLSGVVDYTLVYISAEGKLCSAPLSAEYSLALPIENMGDFELGEGIDVIAHTFCESTSVRVSAPRRLQLRSHLRTSVGIWGKKLCTEKISGMPEGESVERLIEKGNCCELLCESSDVISLEDSFELSADERVALADGIVSIKDNRLCGDALTVSGEIIVRCLVAGESEEVRDLVRRLPFDSDIELDGIELPEGASARVCGYVTDLSINAEECVASISANAILEVCVCTEREFEYTKDAYSVTQDSECEYSKLSVPRAASSFNSSLSICERMSLEELGYPEEARPIEAYATAIPESLTLEDGKYVLRGVCYYSVISLRDGEYQAGEFSVPFRYEQEAREESVVSDFDALATVKDARVKSEGDALCFECELLLGVTVFCEQSISMLDKIELFDRAEQKSGEVIVCYPSDDDTLWSVAKRYSVLRDGIYGNPETDDFVIIET